jgi:hypothetical protein
MNLTKYIEANTIRLEASSRGGGIEIDASGYTGVSGHKMTAYQNYLGGGMLGSIQSDTNLKVTADKAGRKTLELAEALKQYFHNITNHEDDDWENASFEENQNRPVSAY